MKFTNIPEEAKYSLKDYNGIDTTWGESEAQPHIVACQGVVLAHYFADNGYLYQAERLLGRNVAYSYFIWTIPEKQKDPNHTFVWVKRVTMKADTIANIEAGSRKYGSMHIAAEI